MKQKTQTLTASLLLGLACSAGAALHDRGGGMVYDDQLGLTWLQDWDLARTSGVSPTGLMTWDDAKAWADGLDFGGYTDWRLPRMTGLGDPACDSTTWGSAYCGGTLPAARDRLDYSELSHLWFVSLDATPRVSPITGQPFPDPGVPPGSPAWQLFSNLPLHLNYWLADRYLGMNLYAWSFTVDSGDLYQATWVPANHAVAVRQGDVLAAIPEPATTALWLAGLGVLTLTHRRARRRAGAVSLGGPATAQSAQQALVAQSGVC